MGATSTRHQNRFKPRVRLVSDLTVHLLPAESLAPAAGDDPTDVGAYLPPDIHELRPMARFANVDDEPPKRQIEKRRPTMGVRRGTNPIADTAVDEVFDDHDNDDHSLGDVGGAIGESTEA